MGDRANLYFRNNSGSGVGVYGHWSGVGMADAAAAVVSSKSFRARLGDPSYAIRIGVQTALHTLGADAGEETGFGIWTTADGPDDNEYRFIVIDVHSGKIYVTDKWQDPPESDAVPDPTASAIRARMAGGDPGDDE